MRVTILCASPSCTTQLPLERAGRDIHEAIIDAGWTMERRDGEDARRPYCPRCKEST